MDVLVERAFLGETVTVTLGPGGIEVDELVTLWIQHTASHCIVLSEESRAVIAGFIAPTDVVNQEGIMLSEKCWAELMKYFPVEAFWEWARAEPEEFERYIPDAGY